MPNCIRGHIMGKDLPGRMRVAIVGGGTNSIARVMMT